MELLRQNCSRRIKIDLCLHRGKKWVRSGVCSVGLLLHDRIRNPVINTCGEPPDSSLSYVNTIHLKGCDYPCLTLLAFDSMKRSGFFERLSVLRWILRPEDIEGCVESGGKVVFQKAVKLILEDMALDWAWMAAYPHMFAKCGQIVVKNLWLTGQLLDPELPSSEAYVMLSMESFDRRVDFFQTECNPEGVNVLSKQLLKKVGELEKEEYGSYDEAGGRYYCRLEDLSYYMNPSGPSPQSGQVLEKELQG